MQDAEPKKKRPWKPVLWVSAVVVVVLILAVWQLCRLGFPVFTSIRDNRNETLCKANLHALGTSLNFYRQRFKSYPRTRSGLEFLLAPLKAKMFEPGAQIIQNMYVCPGDDAARQAIAGDVLEAYRDLANIDPAVISYAGRNTVDFPLDPLKAKEEPIACDAGGPLGKGLNHRQNIHVLFLDGHLESIDVSTLPGGEEGFKVGPDAPHPWLRVLNKDT